MKLITLLLCCGVALSKPAEHVLDKAYVEWGGDIEGDILLPEGETELALPDQFDATSDSSRRWPGGRLDYYIDESVFDSGQVSDIVERANNLQSAVGSCITLNRMSSEGDASDYCRVQKGAGCSSYIGRIGGSQRLSLEDGCFPAYATVMHEFAHALGFYHTQSRRDRDNHVTINFNNITPGAEGNFAIAGDIDHLGTSYDYDSMMHYGGYAFAVDPTTPTIQTRDSSDQDRIGQRNQVSSGDIRRIRALYC